MDDNYTPVEFLSRKMHIDADFESSSNVFSPKTVPSADTASALSIATNQIKEVDPAVLQLLVKPDLKVDRRILPSIRHSLSMPLTNTTNIAHQTFLISSIPTATAAAPMTANNSSVTPPKPSSFEKSDIVEAPGPH